jgi:hypothetical protein
MKKADMKSILRTSLLTISVIAGGILGLLLSYVIPPLFTVELD